ncbi:MAG: BrxA/BrxB family bacilliredoxin [Longimicrobiales bacterium]
MPYSELMIAPMRRELSRHGVEELRSAEEVDSFMEDARTGTTLVAVNSMCGCASGTMRPAVAMALGHRVRPERAGSVFAGQDLDATARARAFLAPYPPSSPAIALFRDGTLVFLMQRHEIKGRAPETVAASLVAAFEAHCATTG